jgi:ankyrin repeat protein
MYKFKHIPTDCIAIIKHFVPTRYLLALDATCTKVKASTLSKNEISARKCGYYNRSVKQIFESKSFRCSHPECLLYLQSLISDERIFLNFIRSHCNFVLYWASERGHIEIIKILLSSGLTIEDIRNVDCGAVFWACANDQVDVIKLFIYHGLTINDIRNGIGCFQEACQNGRDKVVEFLLSFGLTVDDIRSDDNTAICYAALHGRLEIIKMLIKHGLTLEDVRTEHNYALRHAANRGHIDVVKYLVSLGLTLSDIRSRNNTALHWARTNGHTEVVEFLLSIS